ncbi:E3 ubiquitin-protein ligase RNFT1 [Anopheles maculipalpis]|uniref:E3 ubiquitin-protein ligase RNFT1 n=1 Tax=Anopheles maculipalpis TaxID=1496333 RepID=UPI002159238D|nr:E3 ubiquitin-protein ligase RNFT1 [Anopheles maculipalpis]
MSDTKVIAESNVQQTENQREDTNRAVEASASSSVEGIHVAGPTSITTVEASPAATIVPTDISNTGEISTSGTGNPEQSASGSVVPPTATSLATAQARGPSVERQTSVGSIDSTSMSIGAGSSNGSGPGGFRTSLSNGRMFSRFMSVGRGRGPNSHRTTSRRGSNFSNVMFNDLMSLLQQARHPVNLFSTDRTGLFLNSERSHGTGTSTPPMMGSGVNGNAIVTSSDVVIDVDEGSGTTGGGGGGGGSLRSSHNELYPISHSSSTGYANVRPFIWMQSGDESAPTAGPSIAGGRSPLMPNFNYSHHHHHFHNHQPLALNHQQSSAGLSAATASLASQSPISTGGVEGVVPSANGESARIGVILTPTTGNAPTIGAGGTTRSNSISSNQQNEDPNDDALNQLPESRALIEAVGRYVPLLIIVVAKLSYDHLDGIMHFLLLLLTFYHSNWVVRQEISKQKQRRVIVLLRELIILVLALLILGLVMEWKIICLVILFIPDHMQQDSLKGLLFAVCITDLILKLIIIVIKIIVTLMPPSVVDYKSRGKVYLMIEALSQLYRAAAPIQPWLTFLFESYSGSEKMVGVILSAVYIVAKSTDLLDRIKFCRRSFIKLLQKTSYGNVPTKEQLQACGGQCSICHDNFNSPVLLECNHIFCELCVGTWFDREQTCPLCRAKIVDDPSYRDGATTLFLQLY